LLYLGENGGKESFNECQRQIFPLKFAMIDLSLSIVTCCIVDADIERAWSALTEPDQVAQWRGPAGFTNTIDEMDGRPGGRWVIVIMDLVAMAIQTPELMVISTDLRNLRF
jgi:hypothetical protein